MPQNPTQIWCKALIKIPSKPESSSIQKQLALIQPLATPQEFGEGLVGKLFGIFYSRPSQIGVRLFDVNDVR
jgi:hypothetical protein